MKCPFTQEDVNNIQPRALAISYNLEQEEPRCGHESCIRSLTTYLCSGNATTNNTCPCCCLKITDVYDGLSNDVVFNKSEDVAAHNLISFKYAAYNFHLAVSFEDDRQFSMVQLLKSYGASIMGARSDGFGQLAQNRIMDVLDMEENNMKILHKGRVLFPIKGKSITPRELSQKLIEISIADLQMIGEKKRRKSPSLIVMGTPKKKMEESQRFVGAGELRYENTMRGKFSHFTYRGIFTFIHVVKTSFGATILLFKTMLPGARIDNNDMNN